MSRQILAWSTPQQIPGTSAFTYYSDFMAGINDVPSSSIGQRQSPVAAPGVFRNLAYEVPVAPGAGKSYTLTLLVNGVASALSVTLSDTATRAELTGVDVTVAANDRVSLRHTSVGNPSSQQWWGSIEFDGDTDGVSVYSCNTGWATNSASRYTGAFRGELSTTATLANHETVASIAGNITALCSYVDGSVSAGQGATMYLVLNGVRQDGSGGTVNTAVSQVGTAAGVVASTFTLPIVRGDRVAIEIVGQSTAGFVNRSHGIRFEASTVGQFIIARKSSIASSSYFQLTGPLAYAADYPGNSAMPGSPTPYTVSNPIASLNVAPGASQARHYMLRANRAHVPGGAFVISGSETSGEAICSFYLSGVLDQITARYLAASAPAAAVTAFSLIGNCETAAPVDDESRGGLFWPHHKLVDAGFQAINSVTVKYAWMFRAPKDGTINRAGFRISAATSVQTMRASLQDLLSSAQTPDETQDQYRDFTPAVGWLQTGLLTSDGTDGGTKRTVVKGDFIALVVEWVSTAGAIQLQAWGNANESWKPQLWQKNRSSGGSWATAASLASGNFAIQYDDGTWAYIDGALPCSSDAADTFNATSAANEIGMRFTAPYTGASLAGLHVRMDAAADFELVLYDDADEVLVSAPISDPSNRRASASSAEHYYELPLVELTGGAVYRLVMRPLSTSNITFRYVTVASNDVLAAWPMGAGAYYTSRAYGGGWTDVDTRRPDFNLVWADAVPAPSAPPASPSSAPVAILEMCFGLAPSGKPGYRNWVKEHPNVIAHWFLSDVPAITAEDAIFPNDAGIYGGSPVKGRGMLPEFGLSTYFDGVDDYVEVDYDFLGLGLDDPFTFVALVSPDSVTSSGRRCIHQSGDTGGYLALDATGHFLFGVNGGSVVTLAAAVEAGGEYFVVGRFDGTNCQLDVYDLLNERADDPRKLGVLLGSAGPSAISVGPHGGSDAFIGKRASEDFAGRIQGVACFGIDLSDDEVDELLECATWTDVSGDARAEVPIETGFGLFDETPTARVAPVGVCTFGLDNSHDNEGETEGWYSPDHANVRAGFTRGIAVRASIGSEAAGSARMFIGSLKEIKPESGRNGSRITHCSAADWMEEAAAFPMQDIETQENITADEVLELILSRMVNHPHAINFDAGSDTYPIALDDTKNENAYAQSEFDRLMMSEMGLLYVTGDGTLRFENRTSRASLLTVAATYDDSMAEAEADASAKQIINYVRAVVNPRDVDASPTTSLYEASNRLAIDGGSTRTFLQFRDPTQRASRFGGLDVVTPVPSTHYDLNTADDGSGADVTASPDITVTFEISGSGVYMNVENNYGQRVYMAIEILGKGVRSYEPVEIIEQDEDSIRAVGRSEAVLNMPYQTLVPIGQGAAQQVLSIFQTTQTRMKSVLLPAHKDATYLAEAIDRVIADRVAVRETITGVDGEFFVIGRKLRWERDKAIWLELFLTPADTQEYWILGTSVLDTNTRLGFA